MVRECRSNPMCRAMARNVLYLDRLVLVIRGSRQGYESRRAREVCENLYMPRASAASSIAYSMPCARSSRACINMFNRLGFRGCRNYRDTDSLRSPPLLLKE